MNRINGIPTIGAPRVEISIDDDLAGLEPPVAMLAQIIRRNELIARALEAAGYLPIIDGGANAIPEHKALAALESWKLAFPGIFPGESLEHAANAIRKASAEGKRIRSIRARAVGHVHIQLHDS